jgi:NADH:ubiquinone oxidoreductase subunit 6 (subunit J)
MFLNSSKKTGIIISIALALTLSFIPDVFAGTFLPLPETETLDIPTPEGDTALEKLEDILGPFARMTRIIVAAVAILMIVVSGVIMVVTGENEENVKNQKKSITYAVIGLMMISIAGPLAEVFDYRAGNIFESGETIVERVNLFDDTTRIVITFIKYLLGGLAALMLIRAGATMVSGSASEEEITREKKNLVLIAAGLGLVLISDLVVRRILYDTEYNDSTSETVVAINQSEFVTQVVAVTNIMVSFVGPIMMLGLVIGGFMYVTAGGDEEKSGLAKKILMNSVIGIVIIYGAFALVSTVITGVF